MQPSRAASANDCSPPPLRAPAAGGGTGGSALPETSSGSRNRFSRNTKVSERSAAAAPRSRPRPRKAEQGTASSGRAAPGHGPAGDRGSAPHPGALGAAPASPGPARSPLWPGPARPSPRSPQPPARRSLPAAERVPRGGHQRLAPVAPALLRAPPLTPRGEGEAQVVRGDVERVFPRGSEPGSGQCHRAAVHSQPRVETRACASAPGPALLLSRGAELGARRERILPPDAQQPPWALFCSAL